MAEATGLRNNALPYPVYGVPWGVVMPLLDADGDLVTGATTPDAERSLNGDTFADCTNESTEIATNSGMYYLLLTAAEMTADVVAVIAKSATAGMKTTAMVFYPAKLVTLRSGTVGANAADGSTLQLDSSASPVDDYYNGCLLVGTLDSNVEARVISDYVGSTKVCTVSPNFVTTPDNNDTFVVYQPLGRQFADANAMAWNGTAVASPHTAGYPVVTVKDGTGTGEIDTASGVVLAKDHTGANLATASALDAVDNFVDTEIADIQARLPAALVSGRIDASVGAMAANVMTAAAAAADLTTELQSGLATAAALDAVDNFLDTEVAAIKAVTDLLPDGGALTSLATQASVNTIDDFLDTEIAAIKSKTDQLTFTTANQIDANIQSVNDVAVQGTGASGNEWRPV